MSTPYQSYATLIKAIILADKVISDQEREMFDNYFMEHFGLDPQSVADLWAQTPTDPDHMELRQHLDAVRGDLADRPMAMVQFLRFLNRCVFEDGIVEGEYETFEEIEKALVD